MKSAFKETLLIIVQSRICSTFPQEPVLWNMFGMSVIYQISMSGDNSMNIPVLKYILGESQLSVVVCQCCVVSVYVFFYNNVTLFSRHKVPEYVINLDLPYEQRWNQIATDKRQEVCFAGLTRNSMYSCLPTLLHCQSAYISIYVLPQICYTIIFYTFWQSVSVYVCVCLYH